jgi:CheY-like chemotaxis protein
MHARPRRVLLLEDDPLMHRFVSYALEDFDLLLTCCSSVAQAMDALSQQSFSWILTDLMMPGESGLDFIEKISRSPAQLGQAEIVALSAGINAVMQDKLTKLGVVRQLLKPVSVKTLQELFQTGHATVVHHTNSDDRARAIACYFDGQTVLYEKFAQQCRTQFGQDIIEADRAIQEKDYVAMHNLSHSLKSVLLLLGQTEAHHCAATLEMRTNAESLTRQAEIEWQSLKKHLTQLMCDSHTENN